MLIKPKSWERYGLKPWIEAAKKRLHHTFSQSRLPTSWPASPGAFWLMAGTSRRGRSMKSPPNLFDRHSTPTITGAAQNEEPAMT